jgi:hypothetical protein
MRVSDRVLTDYVFPAGNILILSVNCDLYLQASIYGGVKTASAEIQVL